MYKINSKFKMSSNDKKNRLDNDTTNIKSNKSADVVDFESIKSNSQSNQKSLVQAITINDLNNLAKNYNPSDDNSQGYMGKNHRIYFFGLLSQMRENSINEMERINANIESLRDFAEFDEFDIASRYTEISNSMTQIERLTNLVRKIDKLIEKIQNGTYGYCEESGEEIGIKRLMVRPIATMSISLQKDKEIQQTIIKNSVTIDDEE